MSWAFLAAAVLLEVAGTLSLRMAVRGRRAWYLAVATGYVAAFSCLSAALGAGMGVGVAYGVWTAAGVALTALAGKVLFDEVFNRTMALGVALIVAGVLLVELGSTA